MDDYSLLGADFLEPGQSLSLTLRQLHLLFERLDDDR